MADPRLTIARRELQTLRSEKTIVLALLIQLFIAAFSSFLVVGLPDLTLGRAAFASAGIAPTPALGLLLLLAPLALHATTTSIAALGATRDRTAYVAALVPAVAVHAAYNLAVVSTLG